jgi:serine/threonine-protein kinase HipA
MCQALGVPPTTKYENEGGPSAEAIANLLRRDIRPRDHAGGDVDRFVDALAFSWLIAGTDAHAKNYSVLTGPAQVRLAPLYDVASALPYDDRYLPRLTMAMRIGGEYRVEAVAERHWRRLATSTGVEPDRVIGRVVDLAGRLSAAFAAAADAQPVKALGSALPDLLLERVTARAGRCAAMLGAGQLQP